MLILKKGSPYAVVFMAFVLAAAPVYGMPPIPARIGGTVTVDGVQLTQSHHAGYTFVVTRPDGTPYTPQARDPQPPVPAPPSRCH